MPLMLEKLFRFEENNTNLRTETLAGITTFMTMAYILAVNPLILSQTGMDKSALITTTALSAIIGTLIMAFYANLPFGLAPGLGLNAFFAYSVVMAMGYSWQFALTAVFIEGIIFIILTITNLREAIVKCLPDTLKNSITCGIGMFIAFIGLLNAGIVKSGMKIAHNHHSLTGTALTLGDISSAAPIIAIIGIILGGFLMLKNFKGSLLVTIIFLTVLSIIFGVTSLPSNHELVSLPPSIAPIFAKMQFSNILSFDMVMVVFTFLFVDLFGTIGVLIALGRKAGMINKNGSMRGIKQGLMGDAVGTTSGAVLGTSAITVFVESATGVAEGGRTGFTAFIIALFFGLSLFFAPIFKIIPACAVAPALILVGLFMISPIVKIDFNDLSESIPAFFTMIMMPLSYSIANGIAFGVISYVILKFISFRFKELNLLLYILAILFILKFLFGL